MSARGRRRGASLAEALVAGAVMALVALLLTQALAAFALAETQAMLGAQARRLLEQDLEEARSGRGVPQGGASGPLSVAVSTSPGSFSGLLTGSNTPSCGGCSGTIVTSGVGKLTQVSVTISSAADGSVVARGATVTPW